MKHLFKTLNGLCNEVWENFCTFAIAFGNENNNANQSNTINMKKTILFISLVVGLLGAKATKMTAATVEVISGGSVVATLTEESTNVFSGLMFANGGQQVTFREQNGTVWGNSTTAGSFKLVSTGTYWDCWFPSQTGDWLVQVDLNKQEWSAALVNSVYVNNMPMFYNVSTMTWKGAVTTTEANTALTFIAIAGRYDYTTSTGYCVDQFISGYMPTTYSIASAGTYTISLSISNAQYVCTWEAGDNTGVVLPPVPSELKLVDKDNWSTVLTTLAPIENRPGVFGGVLEATTPWQGFRILDAENNINYGCDPNDKTHLTTASGNWNFWIDREALGLYDIEVNLYTMHWTHKEHVPEVLPECEIADGEPTMDYSTIVRPTEDLPIADGRYTADWQSVSDWTCPDWFRDAKFGIWAHWSLQCFAEDGDWYGRHMYLEGDAQNLWHKQKFCDPSQYGLKEMARDWKGEHLDAKRLVNLYKSVGAKYFMALANHHENFDLWDSPYQEWNAVNLGPQRDLVAEWKEAADEAGLPFGVSVHASHAWTWLEPSQDFDGKLTKEDGVGQWWEGLDPQELYAQNHEHSSGYKFYDTAVEQWNWGNGASQPSEAYKKKFQNRTFDLINKFHPDMVYFDDTAMPFYGCDDNVGKNILAHYYNVATQNGGKPEVVVTGKQLTAEQKQYMLWDVERGIPDRIQELPWQTCSCIGSWHYDVHVYQWDTYKSAALVVQMLVDIVSKNGNLLLSVPVRGDGTIDDKEEAILADLKAWLDINGKSIYGTRPWKICGEGPSASHVEEGQTIGFNEGANYTAEDVRYNKKGDILYATILDWPSATTFTFEYLGSNSEYYNGEVESVTLLGHGAVAFTQDANGLKVTLPALHPNNTIAPVLEITFSGTSVESVQQSAVSIQKIISDGQVLIMRDKQCYTVLGTKVQ